MIQLYLALHLLNLDSFIGGGTLVGDINGFPVPEISQKDKEKIEELATKAFESQCESEKLISLEGELEKMIFEVYGLNEKDIDLITEFS